MVILDTSALSALIKIQRLDLLKLFPEKTVIPPGVHKEILEGDITQKTDWKRVHVVRLDRKEKQLSASLKEKYNLGKGEAEVLALCKSREYSAVIDERKASKIADTLGIKYTGTLNVIRKSYQKNLIKSKPELKRLLAELREKDNFYISDELYKWIVRAEKR